MQLIMQLHWQFTALLRFVQLLRLGGRLHRDGGTLIDGLAFGGSPGRSPSELGGSTRSTAVTARL